MTRTLLKPVLIASTSVLLMAAGPKADLNQDGQVTKAEFTEAAKAHFLSADTNGDSFLSEGERTAFREAKSEERKGKRFDHLDADGDGSISRSEMQAAGEKFKARKDSMKLRRQDMKAKILERYDTNLDGELSDAERTVMRSEWEAKGGKKDGGRTGKRGKRGERPNPDANGDGFVSLDEHMAISEQLFTRLDANSDGVLTEGEGRRRKGRRGWGKRGG